MKRVHAQFGGLLQHQVHLFAARHALHQGDAQRRFARHRRAAGDLRLGAALGGREQARGVVVAVAVEQRHGVARLQPQHAQQVRAAVLGQGDALADGQRLVDVAADDPHGRVASSMAVAVTSARWVSSSSPTQ